MKAIMVMFDSLNRSMLPPYGCDWTHAPNFKRLAEKTVTFDNSYAASLPCMPARRELHTGRYNLLHRSWGPIEPFDDSMPEILRNNGVYTHLISDHQHYWEDGGCTYHHRYSTWEIVRGQEGDRWKGQLKDPDMPEYIGQFWRQDAVNRSCMTHEEDQPQPKTFELGLEFIEMNREQDNWFLQLETFDPHEPFFTMQQYKDLYPHEYNGPHFDWPPYGPVTEGKDQVEHCRYQYAALLSMCDHYLGKVLDMMDKHDMWKNTMLIVNTDHGYLLGEHDWWAKCVQPFYNEVAHTPLFIWDPRLGTMGEHRKALVQTIDLAPTLLEFFGVNIPENMQGKPLKNVILSDEPVREAGLFGIHGGHLNVTDGRYIYMRAPVNPDNQPLYDYTLMPTHMRSLFSPEEMKTAVMAEPFRFTKECPVMRIDAGGWKGLKLSEFGTMLFDLERDPCQQTQINDEQVEKQMISHMLRLMKENDAPAEQYERLGLCK